MKDVDDHVHVCRRKYGHGGDCRCDCGFVLGDKRMRIHGLDGYLSCGPILAALRPGTGSSSRRQEHDRPGTGAR
jgi:hypothetical protein